MKTPPIPPKNKPSKHFDNLTTKPYFDVANWQQRNAVIALSKRMGLKVTTRAIGKGKFGIWKIL